MCEGHQFVGLNFAGKVVNLVGKVINFVGKVVGKNLELIGPGFRVEN